MSLGELELTNKEQFISKVDSAIEKYSSSPIVKGLTDGGLSLILFLGPAITSVLSTRAAKLAEENSRLFAEEIRQLVTQLDETKLDKDFQESDEFTALVLEILANFSRTHEHEKVKLFAKLFVNSALRENSKTPYKEGFVRIVAGLSTDHIILFSHIYENCKKFTEEDQKDRRDRVTAEELKELVRILEHRILAYCEEMIRHGLIYDWAIGKWDYERGSYGLTEYGKEFAKFLSELE